MKTKMMKNISSVLMVSFLAFWSLVLICTPISQKAERADERYAFNLVVLPSKMGSTTIFRAGM